MQSLQIGQGLLLAGGVRGLQGAGEREDAAVVHPGSSGAGAGRPKAWRRSNGCSPVVRAMAMPAAVPAPSTGLTVNLDYSNQLSSNAAIVTAAQGFLSAMLTGDGDVRVALRLRLGGRRCGEVGIGLRGVGVLGHLSSMALLTRGWGGRRGVLSRRATRGSLGRRRSS